MEPLTGRSFHNSTFSSSQCEEVWFSVEAGSSYFPSNLNLSSHPYNLSLLRSLHGAAHRSLVKSWRQSADGEQSKVDSLKRAEDDHRHFTGSRGQGCGPNSCDDGDQRLQGVWSADSGAAAWGQRPRILSWKLAWWHHQRWSELKCVFWRQLPHASTYQSCLFSCSFMNLAYGSTWWYSYVDSICLSKHSNLRLLTKVW